MPRPSVLVALSLLVACSSSSKKITPPTLTAVSRPAVCADGGGALVVTGQGIAQGAAVVLGTGGSGTAAAQVTVSADGTSATATFAGAVPAGGPYDLTVVNPDGGAATLHAAVSSLAKPELFYVDPSVVYSGISVQATIYGAGLNEPVRSVTITPSGGSGSTALSFTEDPAKPDQVQMLVPAGTAAGSYDVHVQDAYCGATIASAFTVTSQVTLTLAAVTPPEGWTSAANAVAIATGAGPALTPVPRVYLTPSSGSTATHSAAVGAVALVDSTHLTAIVPPGVDVGTYDVIVVNPDGNVGVGAAAYRSLADPPPTVSSLSPGALPNSGTQAFTISGANFRSPSVALACADATRAPIAAPPVTVAGSTATTLSATVNAGATSAVDCVVTVTNADSSFTQYAALVFTNPAQNLYTPVAGPDLGTARRAPVALAGDATATARFLHVVGGDDGAGSAYDSVETAPLTMFGVPGAYATQRTRLVHARAFAGAVSIGRFLYVAGGSDLGTPLATVERAAVLDPADRARVSGLVLRIDRAAGVGPGLWYYRVAAVHDGSDPVNPGGEDLPSDPFPVQLPTLSGAKLDVAVSWASVPHAARYRVYRSPSAGAAVGTEAVIAEVAAPATTFTDSGVATPVTTDSPLPIGSLGAWSVLPAQLSVAREGPGVAWALDPSDATKAYLYVMGGRQDASTALASIEYLPISLNADGTQTAAGAFNAATPALSTARWQLGAAQVTSQIAPGLPAGTTYVYALSGLSASGSIVSSAEVAAVKAGGDLAASTAVGQLHRAGYGTAAAGGYLFAFGGLQGLPDASIQSAQISPTSAPALVNWNNEGVALSPARLLPGAVVSGAFIYVAAGESVASPLALTPSTQFFLW